MKHARLRAGACLTFLLACGSSSGDVAPALAPVAQVAAPKPVPPPPPLFDAAGNLLASGEMLGWLELPRGLTKLPISSGTFHAFMTQSVPSDRIQAFFGARMIAGKVERLGPHGVRLSEGIPTSGLKPKQSKYQVTIVPSANAKEIQVSIVEQPYVLPIPKFSAADARLLMKQEQKRAE